MKFCYSYRTSDNRRYEGVVSASSRNDAFAVLRRQGIRPEKVSLAPGFFNAILSVGKRWIAILLLSLALVTLLVYSGFRSSSDAGRLSDIALPRHYISGIQLTDALLQAAFERPSERYLAYFSQPGEGFSNAPEFSVDLENDLLRHIASPVECRETDSPSLRELKGVVAGLKDEAAKFLKFGGSGTDYDAMIRTRQQMEMAFRERLEREVATERNGGSVEKRRSKWSQANDRLQAMGFRPIGAPEESLKNFDSPPCNRPEKSL